VHRLRRLRLITGTLIVLAIAAPWYFTMFAFPGKDDEGKSFFERFIVHDHFKRLVTGVYTSTPGGTFTYFIEQLGFDCFPWVFTFPGAAALLARHDARWLPGHEQERLEIAHELAQVARMAGDRELATESLLLQATAMIESVGLWPDEVTKGPPSVTTCPDSPISRQNARSYVAKTFTSEPIGIRCAGPCPAS